jgi:ABC-type transporter Mla MlaB component
VGSVQFRVRMEGCVSIVEVLGPLDEAAALNLLSFTTAAANDGQAVRIDLDAVESMTPEAAALLLFRRSRFRALTDRVTLRANGRPGRQAVLRAYAGRRAAERS